MEKIGKVEQVFKNLSELEDKEIWEYFRSLKYRQLKEYVGLLGGLHDLLTENINHRMGKWQEPDNPLKEPTEPTEQALYWNTETVCEKLGVHKETLRNYKKSGKLVPYVFSSGLGKTERGSNKYLVSDVKELYKKMKKK